MNNQPEPSSSKQWRGRRSIWAIIGGFAISLLAAGITLSFLNGKSAAMQTVRDGVGGMILFLLILIVVGLTLLAIHAFSPLTRRLTGWLFRRQMIRFYIFGTVCLVTLIALFYAVENRRGKRAWEKCKADRVAQGQTLDWDAFIPPPVPDEQNFFKAKNMTEWFVKQPASPTQTTLALVKGGYYEFASARNTVATVKVVPIETTISPGEADVVLKYYHPRLSIMGAAEPPASSTTPGTVASTNKNPRAPSVQVAPELHSELEKLFMKVISQRGDASEGPTLEAPQSFVLCAKTAPVLNPIRIIVQASKSPTLKEVREFFPNHLIKAKRTDNWIQIHEKGTNLFHVSLSSWYSGTIPAEDYLAWCDQYEADLDLIREALRRPYARMDGDYALGFGGPIPNYVAIRSVAQTIAARAQSYLLLGEPEKALQELTFLHQFSQILEGKPHGQPTFLVTAMIKVALVGLYEKAVSDGFRLDAWREPQLITLQKQLEEIDLLSIVYRSFQCEPAAATRWFESPSSLEINTINPGSKKKSFWDRIDDPLYLFFKFAPRGWVYQNAVTVAGMNRNVLKGFELQQHTLSPQKLMWASDSIEAAAWHPKPYNLMALIVVPNFVKAAQTLGRNQALAAKTFVACALERYRLAKGEYPENLNALVPKFAEKIPHDVIGGQPLKYRRSGDGHFVLYSVGWNEKDDGGVVGSGLTEKDWVWPVSSR